MVGVRVMALLMSCEACGMRARIGRDDPETFCLFVTSHRLPRIDEAVMDDGRRVEVVLT